MTAADASCVEVTRVSHQRSRMIDGIFLEPDDADAQRFIDDGNSAFRLPGCRRRKWRVSLLKCIEARYRLRSLFDGHAVVTPR